MFDVWGSGRSWIVTRGQGEVVETRTKIGQALALADRLNRAARSRQRNCLTCGTTFVSEGPHNRMCDRCRRDATAQHFDCPNWMLSDGRTVDGGVIA